MYKIGKFVFDIIMHQNIPMPINMEKFYIQGNHYDYLYDFYVVNNIDIDETSFIVNKNNIKICVNGSLEKRYLYIIGDHKPYASCHEVNDHHCIVCVDKQYINMMDIDTMFVSLLCLERRLHHMHSYILHSAYITYHNQAILFSAPSGTGKSTQAALWEKFRHAKVINGDRSLLMKDGHFKAFGLPICGSSKICLNECYDLLCIVFLSQGKENCIERLSDKDSIKKLLSELMINYYNSDFVNGVFDCIEDLIKHVHIYHLTCDISENAVKCLERQLEKDYECMR